MTMEAAIPVSEAASSSSSPVPKSIHLLVVHGVGRHDRLSSLLHVFQSFRANLQSQEAPIGAEDRLLDWTLEEIAEDGAPPHLKLVPLHPEAVEDISAVYLYEVNYSSLAGVVRHNHRLDLTRLFVGFDMAVCIARLRLQAGVTTPLCSGRPGALAGILQSLSGVFAAATVPLLGLPSLLLRNYTETLVTTFTRFFEDVATFAIDSNGERLIAAHIDKTIDNIVSCGRFAHTGPQQRSELVIAAHSLGSVVVHNHLVRHWSSRPEVVPSLLLTFGSPIGLLSWLWLFLDFPGLQFNPKIDRGKTFFCWKAIANTTPAVTTRWINVVNRLDPIATAFSNGMADLSRPVDSIEASLRDGGILHRYCGDDRVTSTGAAHSHYWQDRSGFLKILLGASALAPLAPERVQCSSEDEHWFTTGATLWRVRMMLRQGLLLTAVIYCGIVAWHYSEVRVLLAVALLSAPRLTMSYLAFFQRFWFGGPSKRVPLPRKPETEEAPEPVAGDATEPDKEPFIWSDIYSFPYRLRRTVWPFDIDPEARRPSWLRRTALKIAAFVPAALLMLAPLGLGTYFTGYWPNPRITVYWYLAALIVFSGHLLLCAACQLVGCWQAVLIEVGLVRPTDHPRIFNPMSGLSA